MLQVKVEPNQTAAAIRDVLWENDKYLNTDKEIGPTNHPLGGHCYLASEVFYELECGDGVRPVFQEVHWYDEDLGSCLSSPHWYLRNFRTDTIIDLTADQFRDNDIQIDYTQGVGKGFVPPTPSARADEVISEVDV